MTEAKPIKVEREKQSFKDRFSDLLEDMWEKIGRHHRDISGRTASDVAADCSESKDAVTYKLELPGMDENDVAVMIESGRLVIRGEKRDEYQETGKNYVFRERYFGRFERSFTMPINVREKDIEASFNKGVLTVKVPYDPDQDQAPRKIKVSTN